MELLFTVLIPLVAVASVIGISSRIASHSFRCKHCSQDFRIKWTRVLFTQHSGNEYLLACPHCKAGDWCRKQDTKF